MLLSDYKVEWIDTAQRLDEVSEILLTKEYIAVDTEFERRTTFYAKLALVQIFDGDCVYLIDPLEVECNKNLKALFEDKNIIKIFHSCKEDLEILYTSWNCKLAGIFDTQVAYSFLTGEISIGYAKLVDSFFNLPVSKKETTSDWLKRPLTNKQQEYAAKDVLFLIEIFKQQNKELETKQYSDYFLKECEELCINAIDSTDNYANYREAKDVWRVSKNDLGLFVLLFNWREATCRKENRTKNHIIKDHQLVDLTLLQPENISQIKSISNLHPRSIRLYAQDWLTLIKNWQESKVDTDLDVVLNPRDIHGLKEKSSVLEKLVKEVAEEHQINSTLLLSKRIIRKLAQAIITNEGMPSQWKGWRKSLLKTRLLNN